MKNIKHTAKEVLIICLVAFLHLNVWSMRYSLSHYAPIRELLVKNNIQESLIDGVKKYIEILRDNTFYIAILLFMISIVFAFSSSHSRWFKYSIMSICCLSLICQFAINII